MRSKLGKQILSSSLLGLTSALGITAWLGAAEPRLPAARRGSDEEGSTRNGRVEGFATNDRGDVDGLRLGNGEAVHFPPHMGREIKALVQPGDSVRVEGRVERLPRGEVVFEASRIAANDRVIAIEPPRPPRAPRGPLAAEEPMSTTGTVRDFARNPHGDIDGMLLDGDVEVKIPPHQGRELRDLVQPGDKVRVEGRRHITPRGEVHLHADRIVAVATGKTFERDEPAGRRPLPPQERLVREQPTARDSARTPSNEEIMQELRALRRLIETKK